MAKKRNAPARAKSEGVECRLVRDNDAHTTIGLRCQYMQRLGIPLDRARLIAGLAFGEAYYG